MRKVFNIICVICLLFVNVFFIACAGKCNHSYALTELSIKKNSSVENAGIYKCSKCGKQSQKSITYKDIDMPIIDFYGSLRGISKENELKISVKYSSETKNFECDAKIKVQGQSSTAYPKKNYTIKFYEKNTDYSKKYKTELVEGWGKENKYCLKANYIDYSQARNVVSAKLYGQIAHSLNKDDNLNSLYNGGAVDGYPVVIYLNGDFLGLYTLNIPKDAWLFDMDDDEDSTTVESAIKHAVLGGDAWTDSTLLEEPINSDCTSSGFDLEFCSTEENPHVGTSWVAESFNKFITFLNNNNGEDLKQGLDQYVDVERAIDCFIYTNVIYARDNVGKNILWVTYDGVKWSPSMYDMDGTWGIAWDGSMHKDGYVKENILSRNKLYVKLMENYKEEINERYKELRKGALSFSNIRKEFSEFDSKIPSIVRRAEKLKWNEVKNQNKNNYSQIIQFAAMRLVELDEYFS